MGGKSTYLRQAAMLVVMAQMGSFVPAESLRLGLVDRIYTRIGASDNVARGRSTFMVEMIETATILNSATARSLILLDEMGRGTATFDGLSLAWATVEFLHAEVRARTLFATHYHELTMLAEKLPRVRNLRVGVKETAGGIVFLHNIEPGAASKSYGIEVARLAGLPPAVIERAKHVLRQHEKQERQSVQVETAAEPMQMTIFTPLSQQHCGPDRGDGREFADAAAGAESAGRVATGIEGEGMTASLRHAAGSLLVVGLGGHGADGAGARVAQAGAAGGMILFKRNIADAKQTRALFSEATSFARPHSDFRRCGGWNGEPALRCACADSRGRPLRTRRGDRECGACARSRRFDRAGGEAFGFNSLAGAHGRSGAA